jgi:hypothetical protein
LKNLFTQTIIDVNVNFDHQEMTLFVNFTFEKLHYRVQTYFGQNNNLGREKPELEPIEIGLIATG